MSESTTIHNAERPATIDSIAADLANLGVAGGSLILVHSSLSSLGWVSGGAVAVVEALLKPVWLLVCQRILLGRIEIQVDPRSLRA